MSEAGASDEHRLVGRLLNDRYRVEEWLGRGGMASVYLAEDERLARHVVVKIPRLESLGDDAMRRRFLAEVRDHSRHEHPHILGIIDHGLYGEIPFAVLQYLGGGDLAERLRRDGGTCAPSEVLDWLHPVANALDFIHERACLHRDVKPGNILFDDQGHPYLSDFGISTALDVIDSEAPTVAPQDRLTLAGTFVGSPAYAPPEAIDRQFTPSYDQYSLATVVYVALSGALPFDGRTNEAVLIAKTQSDPAPLRAGARAKRIGPTCERVIQRALSRDPDDRYPSCAAFATAFEEAARSDDQRTATPRVPIAITITAATLIAAAAAWHWSGGDAPTPRVPADRTQPAVPTADAGVTVLLGSTPAERAAALALCARHSDHCDASEFEGEDAHEYRGVPIAVDAFEVTNADFARFVASSGLVTQAEERGYSWDGPTRRYGASWRTPGGDVDASRAADLPVVHVTFDEARRFCAASGARLPTADEWELAARGRARRVFPWGDDWDAARLRFVESTAFGLEPVGSHPRGATPDGIHDLAGSVWEWTVTGDADGRVIKGGSWDARNPAYFRAAAFSRLDPETSGSDVGFRCVRDRASASPASSD